MPLCFAEMSNSPQTVLNMEDRTLLSTVPGTGEEQNNDTYHQVITVPRYRAVSCCKKDKHHRKLAIYSIICGLSCIGINALIYSVWAEKTANPQEAAEFSRRAKKLSIISIVVWLVILAAVPALIVLISYLLTLQD
ncbi:hypothetical protein L3Q82_013923 [Scortum barcoo]|uniref:Uncharacterized protein n=1 Tax=Scortum barcoo TaxID=214431 RepID=A0ACB8VVI6_9TELE|nr:hypothetical protein L3Q82_013923 [Scortum barcoo]